MGAFSTKAILNGDPKYIPDVAERICQAFAEEGYEIKLEELLSGGKEISVTKGGVFKAIIGMKTALKITLVPQKDTIAFDAGIGLFGQQALPTAISFLIAWPVLITQIWGLVQQSKLDAKALTLAHTVIKEKCGTSFYNTATVKKEEDVKPAATNKFCTNCGASLPANAKFCSECGNSINP